MPYSTKPDRVMKYVKKIIGEKKEGRTCRRHDFCSAHTRIFLQSPKIIKSGTRLFTVAINELLCMKNAGAQIAMDFS